MQRVTLFYSWQSDRPGELCRHFIGKALERAAELLKTRDIELVIDRDTLNEPGLPPVTETILRKIETCDIFLGDLTYVAETEQGKLVPNPNVTIEFGYALKVKTTRRVLLVMNTHWGLGELPFNLGYLRRPATYVAEPRISDPERRARRSELAASLADYIELIAAELRREAGAAQQDLQTTLHDHWWAFGACNRTPQDNYPIVSFPLVQLHLVPEEALASPALDLARVAAARTELELREPKRDQDMTAWWSHGPLRRVSRGPNPEAEWASRFKENCLVEWRLTFGWLIEGDPAILVRGEELEVRIVEAVDGGLRFLRAIGLSGRVLAGAILYETGNVEIPPPMGMTRPLGVPSIKLPTALIPSGLKRGGDSLKPLFDGFWRQAGAPLGSPSYTSGVWAGYGRGED